MNEFVETTALLAALTGDDAGLLSAVQSMTRNEARQLVEACERIEDAAYQVHGTAE